MPQTPRTKFTSTVKLTDSEPPWHILHVPREKVADFGFKGNLRRVVCTLAESETFHCALFPSRGDYFITLSKALRKRLGLEADMQVAVELVPDTSKYGMPMPNELSEVLRQDADGKDLFEKLSPGDQRLFLKLIAFVKDEDRRITRSLVGIELLKKSGGKFDYHMQHDAMRIASAIAWK